MVDARHPQDRRDLVKIMFRLDPNTWHGSPSETLWAEKIDERRVRLRNVPFFAFGVSVEDIVFAKEQNNILEFDGVSIRGGHSTYRTIVLKDVLAESLARAWKPLEEMGCTYEQGPEHLRSIDVPPSADIYKVYEVLEEGERKEIWGFEEGHCGHPIAAPE